MKVSGGGGSGTDYLHGIYILQSRFVVVLAPFPSSPFSSSSSSTLPTANRFYSAQKESRAVVGIELAQTELILSDHPFCSPALNSPLSSSSSSPLRLLVMSVALTITL